MVKTPAPALQITIARVPNNGLTESLRLALTPTFVPKLVLWEVRTRPGDPCVEPIVFGHKSSMCGRYRLSRRKQILGERFAAVSDGADWRPRYNIAPTQFVPSSVIDAIFRQPPNNFGVAGHPLVR
jgi:hypothetical protein